MRPLPPAVRLVGLDNFYFAVLALWGGDASRAPTDAATAAGLADAAGRLPPAPSDSARSSFPTAWEETPWGSRLNLNKFPRSLWKKGTSKIMQNVAMAIMEQNQLEDGRVSIPQVLQPFMGGQTVLEPCQWG